MFKVQTSGKTNSARIRSMTISILLYVSDIDNTRCTGLEDLCNRQVIHPYICCSHLEHRASVNRFISLQLDIRQSVGPLERGISPSQGRYLHKATQTQNKRRQTSMSRVGFEPTTPMFERAMTVHALDRAAALICVMGK
jgi:FAD synthase